MDEIVKYTRSGIGDGNSLDLLRECLHETTQTPVIEDVVQLINKQLDSIAFELLANHKFLKDIILRWEQSSVFRKKHHDITIEEGHKRFLVFDINLKTHVETRHVKEVRTPFARETVERAPDSNMEPLNARFPMHPFEKQKEEWLRIGSGYRGTCATCGGKKTFTCEKCGGEGSRTVRCPKCHGTGVMDKTRTMIGTDINALSNMGKPGNHIPVNVNQYQEEVQCDRCNGHEEIEESCSSCSGKGYLVCSGCKGSGEQYHRHMISTGVEIDEINRIVPKGIPRKWIKQVKASEKVTIRDYLPGNVDSNARECNVYLQHVGITVIPAVVVNVKADGQDAEVIILNNQAFSKSSVFESHSVLIALIVIVLLLLVVALGLVIDRATPKAPVAPQPVVQPVSQSPVVAPPAPMKEKKAKAGKRKHKDTSIEEVSYPVMPVPPPPEETLDQYLRQTDAGVAKPVKSTKKKKKKAKSPY